MTIRVLLVDDQMLVREGIKSLLNLSDKVKVVGEAQDGTEIIDAIQSCQPQVILLDLSMPKMDGIETLNLLNEKQIKIPTIILTTFDDHEFILRGIHAGAKGYLLKDVSLETLIEGIEAVHQGKSLMQPALTERLIQGLQGFKPGFEAPDTIESLSPKEIEVLGLMASGCSNKEISQALHKSEGTIKNHVSNVLAKLGVRDRTRAVLIAIEKGIL
ncbi:response regulator [Aliikangiella coralliicola]|uniref:Response regulator transcription factor n=1 Tax=Aliikangiella coralliicola TaxID=2592383 RepID=A0A545UIF4_9GAMM|nr:response regulator transcription factor [Aliikangiella coralliicola]TQV89249.1 response regulator transcription factor [Aliikangiella coralliicola]